MSVTASEIMTSPVITVSPKTEVGRIAELMATHRISAVPVCDAAGKLVGIVSEEDVLRPFRESARRKRDWWLTLLAEGETLSPEFLEHIRIEKRSAGDIMAHEVQTAPAQATLSELAEAMISHGVKRLPIVRDGQVVGIVARTDLVRALARTPAMLS